MKKRKHLALWMMVFLFFILTEPVYGSDTVLLTEELSDERSSHYLNEFTVKKVIGGPKQLGFTSFDVNEEGIIALASDSSTKKMIHMYTLEGKYVGGYEFEYTGSFGIEWSDCEHIQIYLMRSDVIITIDSDGKVVDAVGLEYSSEKSRYMNSVIFGKCKEVNDCQYVAENNMGILNIFQTSYSELVRIDKDGTEKVIYDVKGYQFVRTLLIMFPVVLVLGINIIGIRKVIVQKRRKMIIKDNI